MALACDLTRVGSIQWSRSVSNTAFTWLGINEGHHDLSHEGDGNADAVAKIVQVNRWYAEQFAYFLDQLKAIPEGDGTMLDNTVVLWCNELGQGNSHTRKDVPLIVAGNAGGHFSTGKYLQFDAHSHNDLLISLCHAMGYPVATFGDPSLCSGELPGLTG